MKLSSIAIVSLILTRDLLVSGLPQSKKQIEKFNLRPSNLFVKCGVAEYRSNELDEAATECFAIIQWTPERVKCKAIAVIMKEWRKEEVKCSQVTIRDQSSRYAGSSLYHPRVHSPLHPEDPSPFDEPYGRSSSVHDTTRARPFNSNHH
ncbi:hypothetical protein EPUL_001699 [Erysiphe pulchra]|uniref:Uncharacterized protein n=1 Tax=Erysiphe pulchra TaxID=225359 RepID=A0A2S4PT43_9PEZI|nr:hypothetical protein EPUL_001699 [Erysiphe pulchra]